jgi:hypothetical protein
VLERRGRRRRSAIPAAGERGRASPRTVGECGMVAGDVARLCRLESVVCGVDQDRALVRLWRIERVICGSLSTLIMVV